LWREDADLFDLCRIADGGAQIERRADSKVRWILGRIELDRHPRIDAAVRLSVGKQSVIVELLVEERLHVSVFRFEDRRVSCETALREQCGFDAACRSIAAMR